MKHYEAFGKHMSEAQSNNFKLKYKQFETLLLGYQVPKKEFSNTKDKLTNCSELKLHQVQRKMKQISKI